MKKKILTLKKIKCLNLLDEIDDNDETRELETKSYLCNQIQNVRNYDVTRRNLYTDVH